MYENGFLERIVLEKAEYSLLQEHINRYAFALALVKNKVVLDVACGSGYGTELIARIAESVVGVDISRKALKYAKKHYKKRSILGFVLSDARFLPFRENAFQVIISFETIEHMDNHGIFLNELRNTLKAEGNLVISTPNARIPYSKNKRNPFHVRELSRNEFSELLMLFSSEMKYFGQCPFTLKTLLLGLPVVEFFASIIFSLKKRKKTKSISTPPKSVRVIEIDPTFRVKKIPDIYPLYSPRFFIVIVKKD
jgi:2-polyprenyl-3-methyl-5-hydroxy-6-metoxy-1,4-benzoquinol methylase